MLLPLGTDRPLTRRSVVVPVLLGLNVGVFVVQLVLQSTNERAFNTLMDFGQVWRHDLTWWSPVTSAFLHGDFWHIFGNMLALFVFGPPVEDRFGRGWFLLFYLLGGVGSGLAHVVASPYAAIGASGAIAGVGGAFLVLFPKTRIRILWFMILITMLNAPAWFLIGLYIVIDLFSQVFAADNGIANMAHLGGYVYGITVAFFLLVTKILSREPYDLFSLLKHKQRKQSFKTAVRGATPRPERRVKKPDPRAEELAGVRAQIAERVSEGNLEDAAERYLVMRNRFGAEGENTTMPRDAQYQIAAHLYRSGRGTDALRAFNDLLTGYPNDRERSVIRVLMARIESDAGNADNAVEILKRIIEQDDDEDTKALAQRELETIREQS